MVLLIHTRYPSSGDLSPVDPFMQEIPRRPRPPAVKSSLYPAAASKVKFREAALWDRSKTSCAPGVMLKATSGPQQPLAGGQHLCHAYELGRAVLKVGDPSPRVGRARSRRAALARVRRPPRSSGRGRLPGARQALASRRDMRCAASNRGLCSSSRWPAGC
ncbi:unnamed protein product [Rangifer tarandus platyrhynchus]|uniref:Uncharacterized protein n=1 Tax=Rangifer tarandus platyrhynchus TaxID=3082113 RepID=A0ACB1MJB9_RANTA